MNPFPHSELRAWSKRICVLLFCFACVQAHCQTTAVKFDKRVIKLEASTEGEQLAFSFPFTNTGNHPLVLTDYSVACTCTVVSFPKEPIMPGVSSSIDVTFDSSGKTGWQYRKIRLSGNTRKSPLELEFRVKILSSE